VYKNAKPVLSSINVAAGGLPLRFCFLRGLGALHFSFAFVGTAF